MNALFKTETWFLWFEGTFISVVLFIVQPVRTQREEHDVLESRGWKQHQELPVQKLRFKIEELSVLLSTRKYIDRTGIFLR